MFFYRKENIGGKNEIKNKNKLQKLMIQDYPVTANDISDEIGSTNKKKRIKYYARI